MIRYCAAVAVLLIYLNLTHAGKEFEKNAGVIQDLLRHEESTPAYKSGSCEDNLCNQCDNKSKDDVCSIVRNYLVKKDHPNDFVSFVDRNFSSSPPALFGSEDPYKCKPITIQNLSSKKPMYWCKAKEFRKRGSSAYGVMKGFFCSGSRDIRGRVFAFRPPTDGSQEVAPVGMANYVNVEKLYANQNSDSD